MEKNPSHYEQLPESLGWLAWYAAFGVDEVISEEAVDHFVVPSLARSAIAPKKNPQTRPALPTENLPLRGVTEAQGLAPACQTIGELFAAIDGFDLCSLRQTAEKTVRGVGITPDSGAVTVMVVGGAPNDSDDTNGLAFSGEEGARLDQLLATLDLSRETNSYLTRAIFWRPPGNREPSPLERMQCRPFLLRLIELVQPKYLLLLGTLPFEMLSQKPCEIASLRGKWLDAGETGIPALLTFNPMLYRDSAVHKRLIWNDLLLFQARILENS
ncbi:MAG: uracil-DNA glycosylase [Alphaproteobacteria bacterium]|nr:uracil-DNA glycosylase [Alphaproteobacteria bacterium]